MKKRKTGKEINRILLDAQNRLDELSQLLEPCFEVLAQPALWPQEKIGPEDIAFLEHTLEMARKFPDMCPAFLHLNSFAEDTLAAEKLMFLLGEAEKIKLNIAGLLNLRGGRGMEIALAYYRTLKIAAHKDLPMAQLLFEDLKSALPKKRRAPRARKRS